MWKRIYLWRQESPSLEGTLWVATQGTRGWGLVVVDDSKSFMLRSESPALPPVILTAICSVSSSVDTVMWGSSMEIEAAGVETTTACWEHLAKGIRFLLPSASFKNPQFDGDASTWRRRFSVEESARISLGELIPLKNPASESTRRERPGKRKSGWKNANEMKLKIPTDQKTFRRKLRVEAGLKKLKVEKNEKFQFIWL